MILFDKKLQLENKHTENGYHKNNDKKAAQTAEYFGAKVERIYDVGVAGIHRLFARLDAIQDANCVVAVAGMEGALASVLGGLVN